MLHRRLLPLLALAALFSLAADAPPAGAPDANQLSLEISALRTLYTLNLSVAQLQQFKTLAAGAADPAPRAPAKVTPKLLDGLKASKAALSGTDDDAIADADDTLDDLWDAEPYDIADTVMITPAARTAAPPALKALKAEQVVTYVAQISSDVFEPVDEVMDAADEAAGDPEESFPALRDKTAEEVSIAVAGTDQAKADALQKKVADFLTTVHAMKPDDASAKRADLETQVKQIVGDIDGLTVIRNELHRNLAELLANPQLPAAVDARLHALEPAPAK